ncbi:acyltransferase family protein [Dyadobacter arcticus]|uniref:Peptidoglycan/LPS O-acetylase OafA/YrhL n=1 Tax=Dyadobacter arcticus TaxID=1078754 RepID=A0ABX0UCZ7_9BACT|nr:acyltransferase [Dyadobacter arcticus]NIJ50888.1 peptidoglycan/LPS O-acetylase OafA/YrhL [Dyadobacter arcticus]
MKTTGYISNLTPLRGIAAMLTVIFHVDLMLGLGGNSLVKTADSLFLSRMYLMVDFFFILSGFVMCHVYGKWFRDSVSASEFRRFTIARFARIYPLHLLSLLSMVVILTVAGYAGVPKHFIFEPNNNVWSFISNLLLIQAMNVHDWFTWTHAAWSISVEWWMYMLFPFLVRPFVNMGWAGRIAVVAFSYAGYLLLTFVILRNAPAPAALPFFTADPLNNTINACVQYSFLRCLSGFMLGMIANQVYKEDWGKGLLANGYVFLALTAGMLVCMHFATYDFITVSFLPFMLLSAAYGSPKMNSFFGTKALQRLGDLSFSIYLMHQPLMLIIIKAYSYYQNKTEGIYGPPPVPSILPAWIICIAFILLTLIVCSVTYRFVEVPARNYLNHKFGGRKKEYEAAVAGSVG